MAKIISVLMNKGGVSKTETSLNLAYGLMQKGKKVLLIDMDPSSNATSVILGLDNNLSEQGASIYKEIYDKKLSEGLDQIHACYEAMHEYLQPNAFQCDIHDILEDGKKDIHDAILKTRFEGLDLIPSSNELSTTDIALKSSYNPSNHLRRAIQNVESEYDFIIIDNQPFENSLTFNSIATCYKEGDLIIAPTKISLGGLQGIDSTLNSVLQWIESVESLPYDFKLLITMKNRNGVDNKWTDVLQETFGNFMFKTIIRYQGKPVADASMNRKILLETPKYSVAEDYQQFVDEVFNLC